MHLTKQRSKFVLETRAEWLYVKFIVNVKAIRFGYEPVLIMYVLLRSCIDLVYIVESSDIYHFPKMSLKGFLVSTDSTQCSAEMCLTNIE